MIIPLKKNKCLIVNYILSCTLLELQYKLYRIMKIFYRVGVMSFFFNIQIKSEIYHSKETKM